jgi:hypothetical protein
MSNLDSYYPIPFEGQSDPRDLAVKSMYYLPAASTLGPKEQKSLNKFIDALEKKEYLTNGVVFPSTYESLEPLRAIPQISLASSTDFDSNFSYENRSIYRIGAGLWLVVTRLSYRDRGNPAYQRYHALSQICGWSRLIKNIYKMQITNVLLGLNGELRDPVDLYQCSPYNKNYYRNCQKIYRDLKAVSTIRKGFLTRKFNREVRDQFGILPPRGEFPGGRLYRQGQREFEGIVRGDQNKLDLIEEKTSESSRLPLTGSLEEDLVLELSGIRD